jgi:hypothetical protein
MGVAPNHLFCLTLWGFSITNHPSGYPHFRNMYTIYTRHFFAQLSQLRWTHPGYDSIATWPPTTQHQSVPRENSSKVPGQGPDAPILQPNGWAREVLSLANLRHMFGVFHEHQRQIWHIVGAEHHRKSTHLLPSYAICHQAASQIHAEDRPKVSALVPWRWIIPKNLTRWGPQVCLLV